MYIKPSKTLWDMLDTLITFWYKKCRMGSFLYIDYKDKTKKIIPNRIIHY